ncbi:hypothetical protein DNTS_021710 [Danionella cerebrum]|uniref:SH3 domain-binding protein 5 n=1 Tax=Danionella cerebrum TaxID=2873325 RepID=A0A553P5D4_9TELE|nr:hypothetical protein DNTS_021710 [Danionella translucida]
MATAEDSGAVLLSRAHRSLFRTAFLTSSTGPGLAFRVENEKNAYAWITAELRNPLPRTETRFVRSVKKQITAAVKMSDTEKENKSDEDSESLEEEEVDPRIQGELEKLNQSTDNINQWETELEDSRQKFRAVLMEATLKLDEQVKKIGKAVEESKPYWEARKTARQFPSEEQEADIEEVHRVQRSPGRISEMLFSCFTIYYHYQKKQLKTSENQDHDLLSPSHKHQLKPADEHLKPHDWPITKAQGKLNTRSTAGRSSHQAQLEAQRATQEYQRAIEILRAAKETIALAEERLLEEDTRQFDSAWQEMLNHATQRVMEAEQSRTRSEIEHRETAAKYNAAISHMRQLEKKLKRTINKSRPYFELKAKYYIQLEQLKRKVDERQAELTQAKAEYRSALRNLETISDEIHERRRLSAIGPRGRGVGAEDDGPTVDDITNFKMESDGISMLSVNLEESCNGTASEEDAETRSTCSQISSSCLYRSSSTSSPYPVLPSSSPTSSSSVYPELLQLPGSGSFECFSQVSPVLGPRSECSGASSPDCEQERGERAEGAEVKAEHSRSTRVQKNSDLEKSLRTLSLKEDNDTETPPFTVTSNTPAMILLKGV